MTSVIAPPGADSILDKPLPLEPAPVRGGYSVLTWGCQMNEDDSAQMAAMLEAQGYAKADRVEDASVILLNTCSVRAKPERKVYSKLGELRELKALNPDLVIGVCGCMAQKEAPEIRRRAPYVDMVIGTGQIDRIPALVDRVRLERIPIIATDLPSRKDRHDKATPMRMIGGQAPKLKAFVSISYGCDKFCAFCIVPLTRGKERSRPADEVVLEVERLASLGTKEVTLLGQTVNSYGKFLDAPCTFAELLTRLNAIEGIERIRYTSPYPKDFHQDVIDAIAGLPKVCEQVHMPVQVGRRQSAEAHGPGLHAGPVQGHRRPPPRRCPGHRPDDGPDARLPRRDRRGVREHDALRGRDALRRGLHVRLLAPRGHQSRRAGRSDPRDSSSWPGSTH